MPQMNRIRVNNVKYNFGTQQYDDFVMRFHGKNTIYDLANGGGKSVLMLLLMQNLIPNCTLDEKQPIEKLFRTSGGSTTIHSLVEWNLDEADIEEDYRYMLTGFCARKAKDSADDELSGRDTAAIEYFNYCIFYRTYNDNDLVNLPLVQNKERITFAGLKNYLKELEKNVPELKVFIFERKGEYQQFISNYGLYESAWEIIRGINKTEGHVRTYFETNYKTTRKVVEDLLIGEIIEKSFRDKTDKEDLNEAMAKTLLDIKDKLMELSEKKSEMNRFEHQKELLNVLFGRVQALRDLYINKETLAKEMLSAYAMMKNRVQREEDELLVVKRAIEAKGEECVEKDRAIACLKVQQEEYELAKQEKELDEVYQKVQKASERLQSKEELYRLKENANDYTEYEKLKKQRDEQAAIVDKARNDSGDYVERLYDYASVKKNFMDERLEEVRAKEKNAVDNERSLKVELKSIMKEKRNLECDLAVAKANKERLAIEAKTMEQLLADQKRETNLLLIEDAQKAVKRQQKKQQELEQQMKDEEQNLEKLRQSLLDSRLKLQELTLREENSDNKKSLGNSLEKLMNDGLDRLKAMFCTYLDISREDAEALLTFRCKDFVYYREGDLGRLKDAVSKRHEQAFRSCQDKLKKQQDLKGRQDAFAKGRLISDTRLQDEIVKYLYERHSVNAVTGQEYIIEAEPEFKQELLSHWPFLAYGIVVKDIDEAGLKEVLLDSGLRQRCNERLLPVFSEGALSEREYNEKERMVFLHGDETAFCEEKRFEDLVKTVSEELMRCSNEIDESREIVNLLSEEMAFLSEQSTLFSLYCNLTDSDIEGKNISGTDFEEQLKNEKNHLQELCREEDELKSRIEQIADRQEKEAKEEQRLSEVYHTFTKYESLMAESKKEEECVKELEGKLFDCDNNLEEKNQVLKDIREHLSEYRRQLDEADQQWKNNYEQYYKERPALDLGYNEEQLDSEFMSMKAIVEQGMVSVDDKQKWIVTLERNMEQLIWRMKRRNANLEYLEEQYKAGEMYSVGDKDLQQLHQDVVKCQKNLDVLKQQWNDIKNIKSRCEGRIEHGLKQLEEQGIRYRRLSIPEDNLKRSLEEQRQVFAELLKEKEEMTKEFISRQKRHGKEVDFYKDLKRVMHLYHLKLTDDIELDDVSEYTLGQLKDCQEAFEKAMAKEQEAWRELEQYKQQTANSLMELKAFELAEVIQKDVTLPKNLGEMAELSDSLKDMVGFIELEQERVEQGMKDMELIKSSFENQCIRRCQDVRTELERLPKLSGITLDGENIQMISLSVPYVPDEQVPAKMAEYIDNIVKNADKYDTFTDRMKYIRNQLSLKRLFSVIVKDMNAIRLNLYKRERITDQSRYLRYEEAVGSTGQSQGIYIQFLIAIINYIANIHSVNSDNTELGKVIFIDNPFGAAKDIYIWEPIFEMLKTNNVQLIVPARGVTPAINGRFDVNYILGQKMVDGKQQTVVIDYRSQVEKTEVEYKKVEFTQNSFDFI